MTTVSVCESVTVCDQCASCDECDSLWRLGMLVMSASFDECSSFTETWEFNVIK